MVYITYIACVLSCTPSGRLPYSHTPLHMGNVVEVDYHMHTMRVFVAPNVPRLFAVLYQTVLSPFVNTVKTSLSRRPDITTTLHTENHIVIALKTRLNKTWRSSCVAIGTDQSDGISK